MAGTIKGLTKDETEALRQKLLLKESSGNYSHPGNQYGFIGGYQMGTTALKEAGLVKMSAPNANSALNNPDNWTIAGGKEAFLSNPQLQDQAFIKLANKNVGYLERTGLVNDSTPAGDRAGYVAASHLLGGPTVAKGNTLNRVDGNGVAGATYFKEGKIAVTGAATAPAPGASNAGTDVVNDTPTTSTNTPPEPVSYSGATSAIGSSATFSVNGAIQTEKNVPVGPVKNPLEVFSSFNTIFTLSCLTSNQLNNPTAPDSYKNKNLGVVVLKSGGGDKDNRVSTGITTKENQSGKFEYYIDNVNIDSIVALDKRTNGTNATNISFEVTEPYSLGIFLQSMDLAAIEAGHENYHVAPYLLTMEFVGYNDEGKIVPVDDTLDRHFPIRITKIDLGVSMSGSRYRVEAIAWNEQAFSDMNALIKEDVVITGTTVAEVLQSSDTSLQYWLNSKLEKIAKTESNSSNSQSKAPVAATPDEVLILFPKDSSSLVQAQTTDSPQSTSVNPTAKQGSTRVTVSRAASKMLSQDAESLNAIGASKLDIERSDGGDPPSLPESETRPDGTKPVSRNNVRIVDGAREFKFPQGTSIIQMISEVVLWSQYAISAFQKSQTESGLVEWFRIESQVFLLDPTPENVGKGTSPKMTVYNVVPYYVHKHHFSSPTSSQTGYEVLRKEAVKEYNYLYSGKNVDVLRFDINFKSASFTSLSADRTQAAKELYQQLHGIGVTSEAIAQEQNSSSDASAVGEGVVQQGAQIKGYQSSGGAGAGNARILYAKSFHNALLNGAVSLVQAEMEIAGDPYFIADSGIGNFNDTPETIGLTKTGTMNYQSGEVHIVVNFRTPVDMAAVGYADFGDSEVVPAFSGLYRVNTVRNVVSSGKFTQVLQLNRLPNQTPDKKDTITSDRGASTVVNVPAQQAKTIDSVSSGNTQPALVPGSDKENTGGITE